MTFLSAPYELLVAPLLPWLLPAYVLLGVTWIALEWLGPRRRDRPGGLTPLVLVGLVFLVERWIFSPGSTAAGALIALAGGVAVYGLARYEAEDPTAEEAELALWPGLLIIAASFTLKCVQLETWPPHLNFYTAWTGWQGIETLRGVWPDDFLRGKENDLVSGGLSPLLLPVLWATVRLFGGTIFAIRFAEVLGSTLLLVVFWLWIRNHVRGGWGLLALAVFAFSPWHLAQSRMGTFLSVSAALALAMLWTAEHAARRPSGAGRWWIAFGTAAGLIGYAYAPAKVLYAFFVAVVVGSAFHGWRRSEAGFWKGPALALSIWALFLVVQIGSLERLGEMFRYDFGLATDTSIWHKTPDDQVTEERQPPRVIAENFSRNTLGWLDLSYEDPTILCWYAPALTLGLVAAGVALVGSGRWVVPFYFLIGALPPLIVFPLHRRSLILWPLVYAFGVVFAREISRRAGRLLPGRWWRICCRTAVVAGLVAASLHGLHLFGTTNSVVGARTYFGPDQRVDMLLEAERRLATHRLYFVDLDAEASLVARVRLFEVARRLGREDAYEFLQSEDGQIDPPVLPTDEPVCFLHLAEGGDDSVMDRLRKRLPGGTLVRHRADIAGADVVYSLYFVGGQPP